CAAVVGLQGDGAYHIPEHEGRVATRARVADGIEDAVVGGEPTDEQAPGGNPAEALVQLGALEGGIRVAVAPRRLRHDDRRGGGAEVPPKPPARGGGDPRPGPRPAP